MFAARASGRQRRSAASTPSASSSRTSSRDFRRPTSRGDVQHRRPVGPRKARGHRPLHPLGRPRADRRPSSRAMRGAGASNLSSNIKLGARCVLKLQAVYGQAIENYMNDAGADIGAAGVTGSRRTRSTASACRCSASSRSPTSTGTSYFTSTRRLLVRVGRQLREQAPEAFHIGHYALGNMLCPPDRRACSSDREFQFGRRENNSDGFAVERLQAAVLYPVQVLTTGRRRAMNTMTR